MKRWKPETDVKDYSFSSVCLTGGKVKVTNPIGDNDSQKLLDYLKANGGLPSVWTKA